jgi:hypothetical protein
MMEREYEQKYFYDVVVRLRDDSYAFGQWILHPDFYRGGFVSSGMGYVCVRDKW